MKDKTVNWWKLMLTAIGDEAFKAVRGAMARLGEPRQYVGRSPAQVREFLEQEVEPRLAPRRKALGLKSEVKV